VGASENKDNKYQEREMKLQSNNPQTKVVKKTLGAAIVAVSLAGVGTVQAIEIPTGNPDFNVRLDTTARYNVGVRVKSQDDAILNNANYDESNSRFDSGDVVTNRVDLLTELDVVYKRRYGARVSAAAWYDHAYNDDVVNTSDNNVYYPGSGVWGPSTPSYFDGRYSNETKRRHHGPSGEILDAFLFGTFDLGAVPVNVRAGRHNIYWGQGILFAGHGIAFAQGPIDGLKAVTSPGTEARELYLPVNQLSAQANVTSNLSISGQYFLEWEPTRAAQGGTFLGAGDVALLGPDQLPIAPGYAIPFLDPNKPSDSGNWGVKADYFLSGVGTFGFHYREFDEYAPWGVQTNVNPTTGAPVSAQYVYAEDVSLYGLSWGGDAFGASAGIDFSYRKDVPLSSSRFIDGEGARGETLHMAVNGLWGLTPTSLWDTGTLIAEIAVAHLVDVNSNESLYKGEGYGCEDKDVGCSTDNFVGAAVNFNPQWLQVRPGVDVTGLFSLNYGLYGNAAHGGGNEGMYNYKVGVRGVWQRNFQVDLAYNGYGGNLETETFPEGEVVVGSNGSNAALSDRDWVSLTLSYAF